MQILEFPRGPLNSGSDPIIHESYVAPTQTHNAGKTVYVAEDLRPLGVGNFLAETGGTIALPILAEFQSPGQDRVMFTQRTVEGKDVSILAQVRPGEDGLLEVVKSDHKDKQTLHAKDNWHGLQLQVEDPNTKDVHIYSVNGGKEGDESTWNLHTMTRTTGKNGRAHVPADDKGTVTLHAEQTTARKSKTKLGEDRKREKWRGRRKGAMKLVAGVLAVKASIGTGGAIDMIGDAFNTAHDTVYSDIEAPHRHVYKTTDTLDGIPFSQYPASARVDAQRQEDASYKQETRARNTIAKVMDQLDDDNYAAVIKESEAYRTAHADELLTRQQLHEFATAIDASKNPDQIMKTLQTFGKHLGITVNYLAEDDGDFAAFKKSTDLDDVKTTAHNIVKAYGWLPKSFIAKAKFKKLNIGSSKSGDKYGGDYFEDDESITVSADQFLTTAALETAGSIIASEDDSQLWSLMHEFGHAYRAGMGELLDGGGGESFGKDGAQQLKAAGEQTLWSTIVDVPQDITVYAHSSVDERNAENVAGVLTPTDVGLASPNNWRRFISPANAEMLQILDQFELDSPGITAYIVAHNPYLVGRR